MCYVLRRVLKTTAVASLATLVPLTCLGLAAEQGVKGNVVDIQGLFSSSGFMGDGEYLRKYIQFDGNSVESPHSPPSAIKITYTFGPTRWAAMYWQNQPNNWGSKPGNNYSGRALSSIGFWARGETGTEVVEFKAGGIDDPKMRYRDSFHASSGRVTLSKDWKEYRLDVSTADLSSMIGGFCWAASADYNSTKRITFFLDDIRLE